METTGSHRGLASVLVLLSLGIAAAAILGPLVTDVIRFHLVDDVINQVMGGDAVALVVVAPVTAASAWFMWRGHPAAPVVTLAPAGYAMYTYPQLALGGEFATEPGNSERFFLLYLTLFLLAAAAFVRSWHLIDPTTLPMPARRLRNTVIGVLLTMSVFLSVGLHLPGLVDITDGPPFDVDYTQTPTVFLLVKLMDLGIVVPVMVATSMGLWKDASWSRPLLFLAVGWGALLGSAVAGMGVVMVLNDDPAASVGITIGFLIGAAALLGLALRVFAPLFDRRGPDQNARTAGIRSARASAKATASGPLRAMAVLDRRSATITHAASENAGGSTPMLSDRSRE
jgi:hypothetical protein